MAQRLVEMDNRVGQMEVSEGEMERRAEEHRRLVHRLEGELKEQGLENRSLRDEIKAATLEKTSLRERLTRLETGSRKNLQEKEQQLSTALNGEITLQDEIARPARPPVTLPAWRLKLETPP